MTREEASKLYRELMQDLRESASTGLDMSPGDPLAGRALKALEAVIDSLPNDKVEPRRDSDVGSDALLGDNRIKIIAKPIPGNSNECNRGGDAFTPNVAHHAQINRARAVDL